MSDPGDEMRDHTDYPPDEVDCCEMCGASFAGVGFWRQLEPLDRWLCEGCNLREGSAIKRGEKYRSVHYANAV